MDSDCSFASRGKCLGHRWAVGQHPAPLQDQVPARCAQPWDRAGDAAAAPEDTAEEPAQSCWFQTQQLLLCFPKYLICRLYLLSFFLMKKDFRSSAADLELLKKIERIKA